MGHFGLEALAVLLMKPQRCLKEVEVTRQRSWPTAHLGRQIPEAGCIEIAELREEVVEQTALPG